MASWTYHSVANLPAADDVLNISVGPTPVSMTTATPSESHVARMLWTFAAPFIFCTGVVGNILILLVMGRRRLRGTTTSLYLRAMALGDLCALVTGIIPEWLEATDFVVFKELHPVTCKLEKFSFFTCSDTAIWILVVFTVDRFIAVAFPLCKKHMCLYGRARIYCLLTVFAAAAKNAHVFWTRGAEYDVISDGNRTVLVSNCGRPPPYAHFERFVRPWIAFAIISIVPFAVLLFCNTWIIKVLLDVKRMREKQPLAGRGKDKALVQMTAMCLSASFCFLLCITPSIVLLIGRPYWTSSEHPNSVYFICKSVSNQLVYVNHSANFFLYCLTGRRFRQELVLLCACKRSYGAAAASGSDSKATLYKFTTNLNRNNAHKGAIRGDIIHMKVRRI